MPGASDEIVWEEPVSTRTKNPIVLKFRDALEANPGQSARVHECDDEKEASATAQAFSRLEGFSASYKKMPDGKYRVWAHYDAPQAEDPAADPGDDDGD